MTNIEDVPVLLERIRMVLAEAGYPGTCVWRQGKNLVMDGEIGMTVAWTAFEIGLFGVGCMACWPCWSQSLGDGSRSLGDGSSARKDCEVGNCWHPNEPRRPPRHLIPERPSVLPYA
jgi:hypothetical protein